MFPLGTLCSAELLDVVYSSVAGKKNNTLFGLITDTGFIQGS